MATSIVLAWAVTTTGLAIYYWRRARASEATMRQVVAEHVHDTGRIPRALLAEETTTKFHYGALPELTAEFQLPRY